MLSRPLLLSRLLRGAAVLGLIAAIVGGVAGFTLLGRVQTALDASLSLTADTLQALDASAGVAADAVDSLAQNLGALEGTAEGLDTAFDDGEALIGGLADLIRDDVAPTIDAVEDTLPGLRSVGEGLDDALQSLSQLPFPIPYDPDASLEAGLGQLEDSLGGLSGELADQADRIDATAGGLAEVGDGVSALAAQLADFDQTLAQTQELLRTYDTTIAAGQELVADSRADLRSQLRFSRVAVALLALAFAVGQLAPWVLADLVAAREGRMTA